MAIIRGETCTDANKAQKMALERSFPEKGTEQHYEEVTTNQI